MGARSVRKGKVFEREIASLLRAVMPGCGARRGLCQPRGGGKETADVVVPFFHVECKHGARPNIMAAVEQALRDCDAKREDPTSPHVEHLWPLAITRADRKTTLATMPLEDFLSLVAEWHALKMGERNGNESSDAADQSGDRGSVGASVDETLE